MKAAASNIKPLPLPSKIRGASGKEIKQKVVSLLPHHDAFVATIAQPDENGTLTSYLRRY